MSFFSSSSSVKAVVFGAVIGFVAALAPSCGSGTKVVRCSVSNCDGCCDDTGACLQGTSDTNCGSAAASCISCDTGRSCLKLSADSTFGGRCNGGTGSGGGDGGTLGKDAGVGDAGVCNPSTCANGCCNGSTCVTVTTTARCGANGAACTPCNAANTCVSGACTPCAGCVDISTGICRQGSEMTACGRTGGFCQTCDSTQGQTCANGVCGGGATCNATTCPDGCCDGATCKPKSGYTNFQCGSGAPGGACVSCNTTCDKDAGICVGGGGGGFDDGGLNFPMSTPCDPNTTPPCPAGECCQNILGSYSCVAPGTNFGIFETCGSAVNCFHCGGLFSKTKCDLPTMTCK